MKQLIHVNINTQIVSFLPIRKAELLRLCSCLFVHLCASVWTCSVKWTRKSRCNWVWKKRGPCGLPGQIRSDNLLLSISSTDNRHIVAPLVCYYFSDQAGTHKRGNPDDGIMIIPRNQNADSPAAGTWPCLLQPNLNQFSHRHAKTHSRKKKNLWKGLSAVAFGQSAVA